MKHSQNTVKDLTHGNPISLLLSFSLPLMLGNIFQQLYTFVDALIVGQKIGAYAMAALGATEWITFIMFGVITGITQGCSVVISKYFGTKEQDKLEKSIYSTYIICITLAIFFTIIGQLVTYPALVLLNTPTEILEFSYLYLKILYAGVPVTVFYNMLAAIMRALGNSRQPLNAMVIASISNILLDLLFISVFRMGIAGAAYATVLAQLLASLYCLLFIRRSQMYQLGASNKTLSKDLLKEQITLGLPMGAQNLITSVGGLIVQATANSFGVLFVTGYAAANKLYALLEIAATSYAQGTLTFTAQNRGIDNTKRIKEGLKASLLIGCVTAILMSCIMLFAGKGILRLFITEAGTSAETAISSSSLINFTSSINTETANIADSAIQIGCQFLTILGFGFPLLYGLYIIRACIQGLGDSFFPMLSSFIQVIMRVSCAIFLTRLIGHIGIFWGEICAWVGADVFLFTVFYIKMKHHR